MSAPAALLAGRALLQEDLSAQISPCGTGLWTVNHDAVLAGIRHRHFSYAPHQAAL